MPFNDIGKEERRLGLGRGALMTSWGGVRAGCSSTLSGGRKGKLQARISSRFCISACACVPPLFTKLQNSQGPHSSTCGVDQRETVRCMFVILGGLSKLERED
jgi:hypothetical protein